MSSTPGVSPLPYLSVPWCAWFCQFLLTALDDIILHLSPLQYISCQTHCQAHFTSVSCWCETHWDPPADCLTLPPPFPPPPPPPPPPPHPLCRSQHFHTFLTAAPCSGSNPPKNFSVRKLWSRWQQGSKSWHYNTAMFAVNLNVSDDISVSIFSFLKTTKSCCIFFF